MLYIFPTDTCFGIACAIDDIKGYEKIYNIKKRSLNKPLAIMVPDFSWLSKHTDLSDEQINFLKTYNKPFTVLSQCDYLNIWLHFEDPETGEHFQNRDIYESFAFRVAHTPEQKKLTKEVGPVFLTSANHSNQGEVYTYDELEITFGNLLENKKITYLGHTSDLPATKPSEIFSFINDTLNQDFLRK